MFLSAEWSLEEGGDDWHDDAVEEGDDDDIHDSALDVWSTGALFTTFGFDRNVLTV